LAVFPPIETGRPSTIQYFHFQRWLFFVFSLGSARPVGALFLMSWQTMYCWTVNSTFLCLYLMVLLIFMCYYLFYYRPATWVLWPTSAKLGARARGTIVWPDERCWQLWRPCSISSRICMYKSST
jgi:hypothetical protein